MAPGRRSSSSSGASGFPAESVAVEVISRLTAVVTVGAGGRCDFPAKLELGLADLLEVVLVNVEVSEVGSADTVLLEFYVVVSDFDLVDFRMCFFGADMSRVGPVDESNLTLSSGR